MSDVSDGSIVRRIQRVRHEIQRRETRVIRVEPHGTGFVSVLLQAESLKSFVSLSFDDHVKLMLPDGAGGWLMRDYTPRRFDTLRGELEIEFALHGSGPFSDWARAARPGQTLVVAGPRGSMIVPTDYAWHLLVADDSAWPAVQRRLEELPVHARVEALVLSAAALTLPAHVPTDLRFTQVGDDAALLRALRELTWPWATTGVHEPVASAQGSDHGATAKAGEEGFAWCAGEARLMAAVRELLLHEKHQPKEALKVAAYWKQGSADFHERLEG